DNYNLTTTEAATTGAITKKEITVTVGNDPAISKAYDGTTTATLVAGNYTLVGVETGDVVTVTGTAAYADELVGEDKEITGSGEGRGGADADNYNLTTTEAATTGAITKKEITVTVGNDPAISKAYDGTTTATLVAGNYTLVGVETGDVVTVTGTAAYADELVGEDKEITVDGFVLGGADADNYNLTTTEAATTGAITKKEVKVTVG